MNAAEPLYQIIFSEIKSRLMRETVPAFFKHFKSPETTSETAFDAFCVAVAELHKHYEVYLTVATQATNLLAADTDSPKEELDKFVRAALLSQLPLHFDRLIHGYFEYSFRVFSGTMAASEQDHDMDGELGKDEFSCHICGADSAVCKCTAVLRAFQATNRSLLELGLMERLCGPTVVQLVEERIASVTAEMCQGMLRSNSRLLENWLEKVVLEWLRRVYQIEAAEPALQVDRTALLATFTNFKCRLDHFLCETYARIIIDQFFNIIIGEWGRPARDEK